MVPEAAGVTNDKKNLGNDEDSLTITVVRIMTRNGITDPLLSDASQSLSYLLLDLGLLNPFSNHLLPATQLPIYHMAALPASLTLWHDFAPLCLSLTGSCQDLQFAVLEFVF